ncbi:hypothetical protein [Lactobacillus amylovorus]|uniref:hypothetical protein n=2 Tax=Lactobacillus amylovorus TaxID=1604 RepID=UPI0030C720A4
MLVATTVSSGMFSVKTTEVKASTSTQTALKNWNKAKAADKNLVKAEMEYSNAEAKPGVKYHVNRVFKMGKRSYAQIKLGRKYVKFI